MITEARWLFPLLNSLAMSPAMQTTTMGPGVKHNIETQKNEQQTQTMDTNPNNGPQTLTKQHTSNSLAIQTTMGPGG